MLFALSLLACKPEVDCDITSTVTGYEPLCEQAELVRYTGESRLFLPGEGGVMTVFLPENPEPGTYGGPTGSYLVVVLVFDGGGADLAAEDRTTTVTIASLSDTEVELRLEADFADDGEVVGPLRAPVLEEALVDE